MPAWSWFLIALTIGAILLAAAALVDRRQGRRRVGADEPAPRRAVGVVDRQVPAYVTLDVIDALPKPGAGRPRGLPRAGEGFAFGHAHPDFATNPAGALLHDPELLIIEGRVETMRELLGPVTQATPARPLVVVAEGFADDVLTTLAANRRALGAPILAATAGRRDRTRLSELTGAEPVPPEDLKSGYLPALVFGHALSWSSNEKSSWVVAAGSEPSPL